MSMLVKLRALSW